MSQQRTVTSSSHTDISSDLYSRSNLTRLQLLYWIGQKLRADVPMFTGTLAFTFSGPLDPVVFQQAFQMFLARSDAFRTVIVEEDGVPQRYVLPEMPDGLLLVDLSGEVDPEAAAKAWMEERIKRPFSLETRLFDTALIRLNPKRHIWYLNQHHLITDAGSTFLVYDDVLACYARLQSGESSLPPPLAPFEAYAEYELAYRKSPQHTRSATYWQKKLTKTAEPLPFLGKTATKKSVNVHRITYKPGAERTRQLKEITTREGIFSLTTELSTYNVLAALYFALLHRLTGQEYLTFLSPVHNRPTLAFRQTIGALMELCPVQITITENDTFLTLIQKMQKESRGMMRHYQYGTSLVAHGNKVHDLMFNYHQRPLLTFADQPVDQEMLHPGFGSDSLALHVHEFADRDSLEFYFDFHEDVFSPTEQETIVAAFETVLDGFLADEMMPLSALPAWWGKKQSAANVVTPQKTADSPRDCTIPHDMLEFQLRQIWENILGIQGIGVRDSFFDLGGSSWQAMRLFLEIEKLTGHYLPLSTLLEANTIESLANILREKADDQWSTLVVIQKGEEGKRPFFCIPGAGGNGLAIARIAQNISPDQPVYTFLIPGLVEEEIDTWSIKDIAAYYLKPLRKVQPHGPYLIGGYSAGAIVAFELAQQLTAMGETIEFLAIIDAPAQSPYFRYLRAGTRRLGRLLRLSDIQEENLFLAIRDRLFRANYLLRRGIPDFVQKWQGRWRRFRQRSGGMEVAHKAHLRQQLRITNSETAESDTAPPIKTDAYGSQLEDQRMRRIFEKNDRAVRLYIPQPYPGRITLFKSIQGYKRGTVRSPDRLLGWGKIARQGVEMFEVPGNHMDIVREPYVRILGQQLRQCLVRYQPPSSPAKQRPTFVPAQTVLQMQLKQIWESVLGVSNIGIRDNFFDLGGTSRQALAIFDRIAQLTGKNLPLTTMLAANTIEQLAASLETTNSSEADSALVPIQVMGDEPPLFCVHGGGGHVLIYVRLAQLLGTKRPFYAFRSVGLNGEAPPLRTVEEMAAHYIQLMRTRQPQGPYYLAGYSMGGVVAFEMARQLQAQGEKVAFLGIIDTPAQSPRLHYVRWIIEKLGTRLRLSPQKRARLFIQVRNRLWLSPAKNLKQLWGKRPSSSATPAPLISNLPNRSQTEQDRLIQQITRINNTAFYLYIPRPYNGPLTLFKSTEGYGDIYRDTSNPLMGWEKVVRGPIYTYTIPGNHHDLMRPPGIEILAEQIRAALTNPDAPPLISTPPFRPVSA
ncbi:MAG: alpha/beta fold hydrolase [Chloroflexi bacterium]|nr:MAG: alpha/beta fold hydrolase [Chloroflexota bacterium]